MASKACCERPPLTVDYKEQGQYETIGGHKTYVVGPADATKAIIEVYDVFGMWSQTLQGADLLASLTGALVLVPDFFDGDGAKPDWLPPDTEEKKTLLGAFMASKAGFPSNTEVLLKVRKDLAEKHPAVDDHVGVFGLCWGGKIGVLATGKGNEGPGRKFAVSGTAHPGALDIKDGEALNVPHILLASNGEPEEAVAAYKALLAKPGYTGEVETYGTMHHGWMGARADLSNPDNVKEFARGYEQIAAFYNKHL